MCDNLRALVEAKVCSASAVLISALAAGVFLGMCDAGKLPKAECSLLGKYLASFFLMSTPPVLARIF